MHPYMKIAGAPLLKQAREGWGLDMKGNNAFEVGAQSKRQNDNALGYATSVGTGTAIGAGAVAGATLKGSTGLPTAKIVRQIVGGGGTFEDRLHALEQSASDHVKEINYNKAVTNAGKNYAAKGSPLRATGVFLDNLNWKKLGPAIGTGLIGGGLVAGGLKATSNAAQYGAGRAYTRVGKEHQETED